MRALLRLPSPRKIPEWHNGCGFFQFELNLIFRCRELPTTDTGESLARVLETFQVTIPVDVRAAISIQTGDYLEASVYEGGILLRPERVSDPKGTTSSILDFLWKKRAVARIKSDIDAALDSQRDAW